MQESKLDPITFEILRHRLFQITDEMAIAMQRVSGSPVTVDSKDYMVAIFNAKGDSAVSGQGVLLHIASTSQAVKHLIKMYSKDGEISDGDVFLLNDPYVSSMHQADAAIITPIFYERKLVAWSGSMTHLIDIGGIDPGGMSPRAEDVFQEGIRIQSIKLAEGGKVRGDIWDLLLNMVREPGLVGLDLRAQLAAGEVAKGRIVEIINHYGRETFEEILEAIIRFTEENFRRKLKELPDGTWRAIHYSDQGEKLYKFIVTMIKEGDSLTLDFSGTSEQVPHSINTTAIGATGGVFCPLAPILCYDVPWNQGFLNPVKLILPEGSLVNAKFPAPVSFATIGAASSVADVVEMAICKMLICSEKYKEDASANWADNAEGVCASGINQAGQSFTMMVMDSLASGCGARTYADGVDTGGFGFPAPAPSAPSVETNEMFIPELYLFRRQAQDSGGPGKFRGGVGMEWAIKVHDAPTRKLTLSYFKKGYTAAQNVGLCGGYPGGNLALKLLKNTDINETLNQGKVPQSIEEIKGIEEPTLARGLMELTEDDVLFTTISGGGGYGDPIERDPPKVRQDVINQLVSLECAENIYGVPIEPDTLELSPRAAIDERREKIREQRKQEGAKIKKEARWQDP